MFPLWRSPPAPRNGDAGPAARLPPTLFRLRGMLPTITKRRTIRLASRSVVLPARFRKGDVLDAASEFGGR